MLKAQTAFTVEIDDVDAAVAEIKAQLDLAHLGRHTVGLLSALPDYIESGVVAALQEALPFDLIGQTSIATTTGKSEDLDQLSLLVLSSDRLSFSSALSEPIDKPESGILERAYREAASPYSEAPACILTYAPLLPSVSGDFFVNGTNAASGGVPFFGGLAVDNTVDYHNSQVIYRGRGYTNRLAYLLIYGEVRTHFFLATITHERVMDETGVVTESEGSLLKTINGVSVSEFLISRGIYPNENGDFLGINAFPYMVDYNDGTDPVIRIMYAVTPDGTAVCGGDIPVGATLAISYFDKNEILASSAAKTDEIAASLSDGTGVALVFSCIGRYLNLGDNVNAEAELLHTALEESGMPYLLAYSGGEICPVASKGKGNLEATVNRAHNCTFVALVLSES